MTRCKGPILRGYAVPAYLVLLIAALACQPAQTHSTDSRRETRTQPASVPSRDLSLDESEGGHTLRKHVGQTDEELGERLRHEPHISAASTWSDRATAEHAVALALDQNHDQIARWLNRSSGHPNLVVDYDGDATHPIGRSLRRGADRPDPCAHATVVLRWTGPSDYYVLTSYPECRE
jgi:toxin YxiD